MEFLELQFLAEEMNLKYWKTNKVSENPSLFCVGFWNINSKSLQFCRQVFRKKNDWH